MNLKETTEFSGKIWKYEFLISGIQFAFALQGGFHPG